MRVMCTSAYICTYIHLIYIYTHIHGNMYACVIVFFSNILSIFLYYSREILRSADKSNKNIISSFLSLFFTRFTICATVYTSLVTLARDPADVLIMPLYISTKEKLNIELYRY